MARSNHVALPGPDDPYWDAAGDELERKEMREHRPWRLDGITVYEWLAARPDLVSLDVPPAAEEYAIYGMAETPPNTDAVYFLMSGCGQVLYVGKSTLSRKDTPHD